MFVIQDVPGKGKGVIATQDIPKGTRIISEKVAITLRRPIAIMAQLENLICQQLKFLSSDQLHEFMSMSNVRPSTHAPERWRGIFQANSLPMGPNLDAGGIFFTACRINHACDSNATNFWNENLNQLTIHAVRDIRRGEEITISYLNSSRNRQTRQEELQGIFKFTYCIIEQGGVQSFISSPQQMLSLVDEQVRLWNDSTPDTIGLVRDTIGLTRAYPDAFQIVIANGDLPRARMFLKRLVPLYTISMGADSPDVLEFVELSQDPTAHQYYGKSMEWKTALDQVPQGLGLDESEDWLWRR